MSSLEDDIITDEEYDYWLEQGEALMHEMMEDI